MMKKLASMAVALGLGASAIVSTGCVVRTTDRGYHAHRHHRDPPPRRTTTVIVRP